MSESAPAQQPQQAASSLTLLRRFTAEDEALLRDALRRCTPATFEAAVQFRKTGNPEFVPCILLGILERFVEPELRPRLRGADDELRLVEDLGVDSLTMMEIIILSEQVLQLTIDNEELRGLRTVGDVKGFVDSRVRGMPTPAPARQLSIEQLSSVLPVQSPFLFLNEASLSGDSAKGRYRITGQESFLQGHFKGNPVMPASLMIEALGQLAMLHVLEALPVEEGMRCNPAAVFFASCEGVRAHRICRPGDTLSLSVRLKRSKHPLATYEGLIRVGQEKAVLVEEFTLSYSLVEKAPPSAGKV